MKKNLIKIINNLNIKKIMSLTKLKKKLIILIRIKIIITLNKVISLI
jgi:hypothetical protein